MDSTVWEGDLPGVKVREVAPGGAVDPEQGAAAWTQAVVALGDLLEAQRVLHAAAATGALHKINALEGGHVVTMIAALQDVRRELGQTEAWLAREVGRDEATQREGVLPDGRRYTVRRGAARKAWEHDEWKHDVRAQITSGLGEVVDTSTGEQVDVHALIAEAQAVHGSSAPKVTALKALGLEPDTYCETVPGTWSVQVVGDSDEG